MHSGQGWVMIHECQYSIDPSGSNLSLRLRLEAQHCMSFGCASSWPNYNLVRSPLFLD